MFSLLSSRFSFSKWMSWWKVGWKSLSKNGANWSKLNLLRLHVIAKNITTGIKDLKASFSEKSWNKKLWDNFKKNFRQFIFPYEMIKCYCMKIFIDDNRDRCSQISLVRSLLIRLTYHFGLGMDPVSCRAEVTYLSGHLVENGSSRVNATRLYCTCISINIRIEVFCGSYQCIAMQSSDTEATVV